ncbi:hypothetical protein MHZ95_12620 [Sporosarcina sp. ACRSM]|uniref:hypothetical protein n=1 Tax=Sporosarcina sp. ACRSM TaxID=2918216 RepID=UPI001EF5B39C|nr:hypothetical protein [Sporosarcina sp. ACRSM]MCG7336108.1 hypothetical protein [Sporosarcina sp. ACRSM]
MIKDKKLLYFAFISFLVSMALNFPFPHKNPYGEATVSVFNIPITTVNGFYYIGMIAFLLLITSFYLLVKSLKKYHVRSVLLAILVAVFTPLLIANIYQKTFATGIYAVSYEIEESVCQFEMKNAITIHGSCELPFENFSSKTTQFNIEFYESYLGEDDIQKVSLMNNDAPYEVTLRGKERKRVFIETDIDVSHMEKHIHGGESKFVTIIIKSEDRTRKL